MHAACTRSAWRFLVAVALPAALALAVHPATAASDAVADRAVADALYHRGQAFYESGHYEEAIAALEQAVQQFPDESSYHHWLGRSYGRLAERSNWIRALSLAGKTLREFRRAVELDGQNADAIHDLMLYYQQAPGFLGGSRAKARELRRRLLELRPHDEDAAAIH